MTQVNYNDPKERERKALAESAGSIDGDTILLRIQFLLERYVDISPPAYVGDEWEAGRNIGHAYEILGTGKTLRQCILSIPDEVYVELVQASIQSNIKS